MLAPLGRWSVALSLVAACSGAAPAVVPPPVVAATVPAVDEPARVTPAVAPAPPPPAFSIASPPPSPRGVVMAERVGATVTLHPDAGPDVALRDGEEVVFLEDNFGVGGGDAVAVIEARGVRGTVPNARVITEARLSRAPVGGAAMFSAVFSCGDFCHGEVWLLGADGARTRVTDQEGPEVVVAWRPDAAVAAVGGWGLHLVRVSDGRAEAMPSFTSPAFASDGALFVRGAEDDDAVFVLVEGAAPRRVFAAPGRPPASRADEPRQTPPPVEFEREERVLRARFLRGTRWVTARATRPR